MTSDAAATIGDGLSPDAILFQAIARVAALGWEEEPSGGLEATGSWGSYAGLPPRIMLLDDGRMAELLADLSYTGPEGVVWDAPAGSRLDGASIPRALWTLIGGPFEGKYRNASIVHDRYCDHRVRGWRATHRMFHDAMRCSGVGMLKAKIMYYAVYRFGPRWPEPGGLEAVATAAAPAEALTAATAPSLALDAEAIFEHDLGLEEIERLADARAGEAALAGLEGTGSERTARARALSIPGGSGNAEDLDAIVPRAALLPDYVLARFERKKIRIVACRGSVTDFERGLRGKTPRGWESTGKTWDDVPGAYIPNKKRVVIATVEQDGARAIPDRSRGSHGSIDLLVHEALHGYDFATGHAVIEDRRFLEARESDFDRLDPYERQPGQAGLEESFAESGAHFFTDPDALAGRLPALHAFWTEGPKGAERTGGLESVAPETGAIGTGERLPDGTILLDLRADDEETGAVGHALFEIAAGDPAHAELATRLGQEGLESSGGRVLLWP